MLDATDDAILETDAVIEKLRTIHVGVVDDLLARGLAHDGSPRDQSALTETAVGPRPATWTVANLGRFVVRAEYGTNLSLGDSSAGISVLRMNNIQDGEFDLSDLKYAPARAVERFRLRRGDVLFNRTNSWEHVGKAAIWRRDEPGPAFASYLVRLHCGEPLLPEFLHLWLNWAPVQRAIRQFATPGVQQVNINPTSLRRALIALPDTLDEQSAIIERVNGVASAIEDHCRQRAKLSSLREGLRDDLLTGRTPAAAILGAAE
jgi:type I restriction enzyme S subunit